MCIKGYTALKKYNIDITNEKMKLFETLNLLCGENNKEYIYNMFYEIDNSKNIEGEKKEKNKENMEEQLEKMDTQHKKIIKEKDNLVIKLFSELDTLKSEYEKKQKMLKNSMEERISLEEIIVKKIEEQEKIKKDELIILTKSKTTEIMKLKEQLENQKNSYKYTNGKFKKLKRKNK